MIGTAAELKRAFDRSFAELPAVRETSFEDFLAIGVGNHAFALRLSEVQGLLADKALTHLPSPIPELIGVAGFRGAVVPVYDLRALLGESGAGPAPRWLALVNGIALAFDRFEGHVRAIPSDVAKADTEGARDVLRAGGIARPIVNITPLRELIEARARGHERQDQPHQREQ